MASYQRQERPSKVPTDVDWAWTAGFLEGEGSFCPMSGTDKRARVSANQKEREPLEKLLEYFGGRIYKLKKRELYVWMLRGKPAESFLQKLLPLMSTRRQAQIQVTLEAAFSIEHGSKERYKQRSKLKIGNKNFLGRKHSDESRTKMSKSRKAYLSGSKERLIQLSSYRGFFGKKHSTESKEKMSMARKIYWEKLKEQAL